MIQRNIAVRVSGRGGKPLSFPLSSLPKTLNPCISLSVQQSKRFNSSSETTKKESSDAPKKPTVGADKQHVFDPRFIGLTRDLYIPPSRPNYPNFFKSPRLFLNCILRRFFIFGTNTIQVGLMRWQTGLKPHFLLWKNKAIENYVKVNKAFASKDLKPVEKNISIWVSKSLNSRIQSLPKSTKLDWKLIKFNEKPKLVNFRPIMLPNKPVEYVQIIYKFNTKQELINVNINLDKAKKSQRDVIDYIGFLIDINTNEVILVGSIFENKPWEKIPKPEDVEQSTIFKDMKLNGDIFRSPPSSSPQIDTN